MGSGLTFPQRQEGVKFPGLIRAPLSRGSGRGFPASPAQVFAPHLTLPSRQGLRCLGSIIPGCPAGLEGLGTWRAWRGESELPGPLGVHVLWHLCLPGCHTASISIWETPPPIGVVLSGSEASPLTTEKEVGPWANRTLPWELINVADVTTQCLPDVCLKLPPRILPETGHLGQ